MNFPADLRYTKEYEWARVEGNQATIGITEYAQDELGDVVYVDLPGVRDEFNQMQTFGTIESVKAVSDLYAPLSGKVVKVNGDLEDKPELVNQDPYGEGWMIRIAPSDTAEFDDLMNPDDYQALVTEEEG